MCIGQTRGILPHVCDTQRILQLATAGSRAGGQQVFELFSKLVVSASLSGEGADGRSSQRLRLEDELHIVLRKVGLGASFLHCDPKEATTQLYYIWRCNQHACHPI